MNQSLHYLFGVVRHAAECPPLYSHSKLIFVCQTEGRLQERKRGRAGKKLGIARKEEVHLSYSLPLLGTERKSPVARLVHAYYMHVR